MKWWLSLLLILGMGCSHTPTPPVIPAENSWIPKYTKGTCFVKWSDPEYRRKYYAGLGKSRVYMQKYDLLIPLWSNGGINIESIGLYEYGVKFDPSEIQARDEVKKIMDQHFVYRAEAERDIMTRMSVLVFRISEVQLDHMLIGYEEVNCVQYLWSQVL